MFQQLLANKHHRLRDSVPITIWPSGGLRLVTDKKKKINKSRAKQEPRSAHGRAVNKWSTAYEPIFYTVIRISGSTITARRATDGREITRDSSQFKLANAIMHEEGAKRGDSEDWRETLLMNSGSLVQSSSPVQAIPEQSDSAVQAIPEQSDSAEETVANGSSGHANHQLEELPTVQTEGSTSSSPTPRVQSSRPRRERRRPAYLTDYIT